MRSWPARLASEFCLLLLPALRGVGSLGLSDYSSCCLHGASSGPSRSNSVHDGLLKGWRPPRVYLFKVLPGVEQGWPYVFGAAPSSVYLYEFIGVWVSAEHPKGLCVRHWVLGVLHTPNGRVVPIHLESSFQD